MGQITTLNKNNDKIGHPTVKWRLLDCKYTKCTIWHLEESQNFTLGFLDGQIFNISQKVCLTD